MRGSNEQRQSLTNMA